VLADVRGEGDKRGRGGERERRVRGEEKKECYKKCDGGLVILWKIGNRGRRATGT
jgi:hypothetical protein